MYFIKYNKKTNGRYLFRIKKVFIILLLTLLIQFNIIIIANENLFYKKIYNIIQNNFLFKYLFEKNIEKEFRLKNHVNLNEIESFLLFGRKWEKIKNDSNTINIGSSLDPNYILKTIMTITSVIISQYNTTKIRLHFSIVKNFKSNDMIKIYSLRKKIRDDVEFNFYNASRVEKELNSISHKGPGLAAKLLLPQLVEDDVKRLIIIDNGDLLVLRDLLIMYNWEMGNNIYMGAPDCSAGKFGKISNKTLDIYINAGNYLIDVNKVKQKNMYNLFLKYKNIYSPPFAEQDMINDIAYGHIGYLPIEYGLVSPYNNDKLYYTTKKEKTIYKYWNLSIINKNNSFLPKTYEEFLHYAFDPVIIHSWNGKWEVGNGMNIYRKLCHYFIEQAGIKKEICENMKGYCI